MSDVLQAICFKRHLDPVRHFLALRSPQGSARGSLAAASLQTEAQLDGRLKKNDVFVPGRKDLIGSEVSARKCAVLNSCAESRKLYHICHSQLTTVTIETQPGMSLTNDN